MEDGEIPLVNSDSLGLPLGTFDQREGSLADYAHDQSWDSARENDAWSHSSSSGSPKSSLRLLVLKSQVLPKDWVAVIDGYPQVELGRDKPVSENIIRIRLKEMEVSKLHATIFWDTAWEGWAVVDMGSKHGTYLGSSRLSVSKASSIPKRLSHLDQLTLGTTTFVVHIHDNRLACEECSPKAGEEISLFASRREPCATKHQEPVNPKVALTQLKRNLMSRHSSGSELTESSGQYIDRSARRRALYPASTADAPGTMSSTPPTVPSVEPVSQRPTPVPVTNIGHKLLVKQGWQPGSALGITQEGRVEPLDVKFNVDRAGLGSRR